MPRTRANRHIANAVKDQGTSKRRTKEITDQARPRGVRKPVGETITGQGGSRQNRGDTRGPHPGTRGGIKADTRNANAVGEPVPLARRGRPGPDREPLEAGRRAGMSTKRLEKNRGEQQPREQGSRRSGERAGAGLTKAPGRSSTERSQRSGRTRRGRDSDGQRSRARGGSRTSRGARR
jgi:hypothetical protein